MGWSDEQAQLKAAKDCSASNQTIGMGPAVANGPRRVSLVEESENQSAYHQEQAFRLARGAQFFRDNPAFAEFIELIRQGSISI